MSIFGNDVSSYQGAVDFRKMKEAGSRFVYLRVGVGFTKDKRVDEYRRQATEAGLLWGLYWLPWPTPTSQALLDAYFDMVGDNWGDLPPALDVETAGLGLGIFKMWADQVIAKTGKKPVIYTRASHFDSYADSKNLKAWFGENTDLWAAHYTYSPDKPPAIPKGWNNYLIHQYSADENSLGSKYGVSSRAIDMDYFNGDELDFAKWIGVGELPDEPETPVKPLYVEVIANFLRFRPLPLYEQAKTLIVEKGQVLEIAGSTVYDAVSDIVWLPVFTPSTYENELIGYISASNKYVKYL